MISKLIRWLARAEIAGLRAAYQAQREADYANGYNAGRVVGHGEMLNHLRGDTAEPVTQAVMAKRAAALIH